MSNEANKAPLERRSRRGSAELRDLILASAQAEFMKSGFSGATTAAIAKGANVTETQLFRMFAAKSALFTEAVFEPLDQAFAVFNDIQLGSKRSNATKSVSETRDYIAELMDFIIQNRALLVPLLVAQLVDRDVEGMASVPGLTSYFEIGAQKVVRNSPGSSKTRAYQIVRVSFAAVLATVVFKDWLFAAESEAIDLPDTLADFFFNGLNPEAREHLEIR